MDKILFIANIQYGEAPTGGGVQFKNQIIYRHLSKCYNVIKYDTWKKNPLIILLSSLLLLLKHRDRLVVFSIGFRGLIPLLFILDVFRIKPRMYMFVPGSVANRHFTALKRKLIGNIDKVFVQTKFLQKEFLSNGIDNVYICPNFKDINEIRRTANINSSSPIHLKRQFVFIGRFIKKKGIEDIIEAAKLLIKDHITNFTITFYGKQNDIYNEAFFNKYKELHIEYKGYLNLSDKVSYRKLWNTDVLLFPTYFEGEGFPGVLIDAFICGLSVIATNFMANEEIINERNGILVEPNSPKQLYEAMSLLIKNIDLCEVIKEGSYNSAMKYETENILGKIFQ